MPALSHFPGQHAYDAGMFEQVIKKCLNQRFEESPDLVSLKDSGFVRKQGREHTCKECVRFLVNTLDDLGIEA